MFYHGLHVLSYFPRAQGGDPYRFWIHTRNPLLALLEEGHTAVALFMVLSGFVFSVSAAGKEIAYGAFERQVRLGEDVDPEQATARFDHGILTVELPVIEKPMPTGRYRITVERLD